MAESVRFAFAAKGTELYASAVGALEILISPVAVAVKNRPFLRYVTEHVAQGRRFGNMFPSRCWRTTNPA